MTTHRRGGASTGRRKTTTTGRRTAAQTHRRRSNSTSDENGSDGGSVTRCVCGETHAMGLMVCCDKCEVWQHCKCMGLSDQTEMPEQYYCEQCKPENHHSYKLANGRIRRQYNASGRFPQQQAQQQQQTITSRQTQSQQQPAAAAPAPKKRMTLNSREASMSLEDVLAARTALEMYEHNLEEQENNEENHSPPSTSNVKREENETTKPGKRKRELDIKLPDTIDEKSEPPSSTVSSVGHDELPAIDEPNEAMAASSVATPSNNHNNSDTPATPTKKTKQNKRKPKENGNVLQERVTKRQAAAHHHHHHGHGNAKSTVSSVIPVATDLPRQKRKPRSRTSTPQPPHTRGESPFQSDSEENNNGGTPNGGKEKEEEDSLATVLFGYFSPQARATSPPAKCRQPNQRMSILDMNRRATQILEYISSIQVEMAASSSDTPTVTVIRSPNNSSSVIPASKSITPSATKVKEQQHDDLATEDDDNDSLSSASTIPLNQPLDNQNDFPEEEEEEEEEPTISETEKEKQSSMEIMDMLTRKLIKFQKRFGSRNRALYEEAMMEGEGRITRSREASGPNGYHRNNMMAH